MSISVRVHIAKATEISVAVQESQVGKYAAFSTGDLTALIHDREKLLEIASLLENAAQKWVEEE